MADDPGHVPDPAELGLRSAAQLLVVEVNARMDAGDIEGALELYAEDAILQAVRGKAAIRQTMRHSSAAGSGRSACHVVSNMRCSTQGDSVLVHCTMVAYLLDGPQPYGANAILKVHYVMKPLSDGNLRIVEQRVDDYELTYN
jgi:ketosteroid isomerase-like protein